MILGQLLLHYAFRPVVDTRQEPRRHAVQPIETNPAWLVLLRAFAAAAATVVIVILFPVCAVVWLLTCKLGF